MTRETSRRIPLDRRVCIVSARRIEIRPERTAVIVPIFGLMVGIALFAGVALLANSLPVVVLAAMLLPGMIITPFSGMGVVYSVIGMHVVIDARTQSVRFQQGLMGLGVGTAELVPFEEIDHVEVADPPTDEEEEEEIEGVALPLEFRAWDVLLVKRSGKRHSMGQAVASNTADLIDEGFARALETADAIAGLTGKTRIVTADTEESETEAEPPAGQQTPGKPVEDLP
ncbi:MAG: hypothetical protein V3S01_00125 [Dehalococcoidia bacterium]